MFEKLPSHFQAQEERLMLSINTLILLALLTLGPWVNMLCKHIASLKTCEICVGSGTWCTGFDVSVSNNESGVITGSRYVFFFDLYECGERLKQTGEEPIQSFRDWFPVGVCKMCPWHYACSVKFDSVVLGLVCVSVDAVEVGGECLCAGRGDQWSWAPAVTLPCRTWKRNR